MAAFDKELEQQLKEAGVKLAEPPSSGDELLRLLDQVERCLSRVEQSPSKSMQTAFCPSLKALVADKLFRHSDVDVKVAVAACISEITRITAPDAPYDDDLMKEVFQLIVSSFENLSDNSSRSFAKRTSILQIIAKVRLCVVMLDLECEALLIEMFQHFLKAIRDDHPWYVFSCMETIMTLVLEESVDISQELLSPILACVKKDNEEVLPIARKLGEKVLESSAAKLKPYLLQAGIQFQTAHPQRHYGMAFQKDLVDLNPANEDTMTDEQVQNNGSRELIPEMNKWKSVVETASEMSIPVEEPGLAPKRCKMEHQNIETMCHHHGVTVYSSCLESDPSSLELTPSSPSIKVLATTYVKNL
ncbi:hypothetical protein ACOSQ3_004039 [Xanthoceras sorbifolium]